MIHDQTSYQKHRCAHRGLVRYPSVDKKIWDSNSTWILQWDNIVKHPGARSRGCHCDVHKPPWLYPNLVAKEFDEPDRAIKSAPIKRVLQKKSQFGPSSKVVSLSSGNSRLNPERLTPGGAGAVDEETFLTAFEDVPSVHLFSTKDLEEQMKIIRETIGDDKKDWNQRVDALRKLRGIVIAGGINNENFMELLKSIQNPFEGACTDLRSQVVKEACITLAFLSRHLKNKLAIFVESLLTPLMNLIQNSAKVMSTSGAVAIRFILQHTHSSRFIPIISSFLASKSKDIRRAACEYLSLILQTWSMLMLQKHVKLLQETIGKGVSDSDNDARAFARKAYWAFRHHFPEQAEALLNTMDSSCKRALMSQSNSGSVNSLNAVTRTSSIPPRSTRPALSAAGRVSPAPRSNSAIDLQAARRAQSRMIYANINRNKATTSRTSKPMTTSSMISPERMPRTKTRVAGVSQSQPSSRSCSPASRMNYATYTRESESLVSRQRRYSGQGMRSNETSREPSPQRVDLARGKVAKLCARNVYMSPKPPVMSQKLLQQSRDAELALADALTCDTPDHHHQKTSRNKGDHSDESETSSISSERSMDSRRIPSDSYSWSGSQQRLYRDLWDQSIPKDIKEIIDYCGRKHWGERKEGLFDLQNFLASGNGLNSSQLRKVTDIFTKMFMDSHTKVFSLFLDTLNELIITHSESLGDWLYVLCTRLLNKLGTDLLGSIQTKVNRTLDVVRDYFPGEQLLPVVMRFLTDPAHTPNSRVKVATLMFLTHVAENTVPSALNQNCKPALVRLLDWTNDVKSQDVRRHAQEAIVALYNLNPPQFPMLLNELPKMYQDIAMPLIQNHLRKSSSTSNPSSPSGLLTRLPPSPTRSARHEPDLTDDHLNPEEVFRSLRRTTAEIQNYGFERMEGATSSKDSGISNMADVEERIESLTLSNSGRSSSVSSPTQRGRTTGNSDTIAGDLILPDNRNNGYEPHNTSGIAPELPRGPEVLDRTLKILQSDTSQPEEKADTLKEFQLYIREGDGASYITGQFKKLLKAMIECLASNDKALEIEVLKTLTEMLKKQETVEYCAAYGQMLVLKVLNEHKADAYDPSSGSPRRGAHSSLSHSTKPLQLLKAAEDCAAMIATILPPNLIIDLALSSIRTEPFPKNVAAIKMIQNLVEHGGRDAIESNLDAVMTTLMLAYDNAESVVRKAAVFCMVAIHAAIGEEAFDPYRQNLYGGKLKLLNIYIQKAQAAAQSSASQSSSPRSNHSVN